MTRYLAFALVLIAAGSAQAAEKKLDRTFTVSPGGTLTVDADGGEVHVSGSDGNQVIVHMTIRGSEENLASTEIDALQKTDGVAVTLRKKKRSWFSWGMWSSEEKIEVTVPRRYMVNVHTGGGSVELRDTMGVIAHLRRRHLREKPERECRGANFWRLDPDRYDPRRHRGQYFRRRRPTSPCRRENPRRYEWWQRALQSRRREPRNPGDHVRWRRRGDFAARHDWHCRSVDEWREHQFRASGELICAERNEARGVDQWWRRGDLCSHLWRQHLAARAKLNLGRWLSCGKARAGVGRRPR